MAINETMMQYFEWYLPNDGLWWQRCAAQAQSLREKGITQVWLPPAYKGISQEDVGYGVYDMYDLGEFDQKGTVRTKYGTKDEYIEAIRAFHEADIKVLADIVLDHRMGGDDVEEVEAVTVDPGDRTHQIEGPHMIKARSIFTFPGRQSKYSSFTWNHTHFSGTDRDENTNETDKIYLFKGNEWREDTDPENGNFDYLMGMNVDQANPEVVDEIKKWGAWYFNTTHFDGLRLDAVKHISSDFYRDVLRELRARAIEALREAGGAQQDADKAATDARGAQQDADKATTDAGGAQQDADGATTDAGGAQQEDMPIALTEAGGEQQDVETAFPVVGEYWHGDVGRLLDYLDRVENLMSLFDVPLHYNFYQASLSGGSFSMRSIFDNTLVAARPSNAVTFVDNHDTQVGQALQSFVEDWFKPLAYAMILLRKDGVPCVFYTDYYGNPARNIPVVPNLGRMIKLRAGVAYGEQVDYFDDDHVVGWVRRGDEEHAGSGLAVLLSSGEGGTKRMEMGKKFAGMQFHDALGICQEPVTIDADGFGEFRTEGGNVSVWTNYDVFADMVVNE